MSYFYFNNYYISPHFSTHNLLSYIMPTPLLSVLFLIFSFPSLPSFRLLSNPFFISPVLSSPSPFPVHFSSSSTSTSSLTHAPSLPSLCPPHPAPTPRHQLVCIVYHYHCYTPPPLMEQTFCVT